jgi:MoaA/NifB/PqqE/SkfB family radical SAM enzyme
MTGLTAYSKIAQKRLGYCAAQLELTSHCFQNCPSCFARRLDPNATWPLEDLKELFLELAAMPTFEQLTLTGGDPQAYPFFDAIIQFWNAEKMKFRLVVSTALMRNPKGTELKNVTSIRLSLDGITCETYRKTRGVDRDPYEALAWADGLGIPYTVFTCLSMTNKHEILEIADGLSYFEQRHSDRLVHWSVAPMIGTSTTEREEILQAYQGLEQHLLERTPLFTTSIDTKRLRNFYTQRDTAADSVDAIPCWASYASCHIKANGAVFPCCLIGGEACVTRSEFRIGDALEESLVAIYERYTTPATPCYSLQNYWACRQCCQIKQHSFNAETEAVKNYKFAMP